MTDPIARPRGWSLGRRIAPTRFVLFLLLFAVGLAVAVPMHGTGDGIMAAFDLAAGVFLVSSAPLLRAGDAAAMRARARANDANRAVMLGFTGTTLLAILVAVAMEIGAPGRAAVVPVLATLVLAWAFSNTVYALHYAHLFYLPAVAGDARGLDFPATEEPDYWDFLYFSFTLGMTFQTSDVAVTSGRMRRAVLGQSMAAFVFNLGVLAFTVNVLGGG